MLRMRKKITLVQVAAGLACLAVPCLAQKVRRASPRDDYKSAPPTECPVGTSSTDPSVASASDFVQLERRACARGDCPVYTVRVNGDGAVTWQGGINTVVQGASAGSIDGDEARTLMQRLGDRGFWPLCGTYGRPGGPQAT